MMAPDAEIRRFDRKDEGAAVRLLVEKLPEAQRETAFERRIVRWKWQYYENPTGHDDEPLIWVAQVGDDIAGMVATVPVNVTTPKGRVLGMWGVDFVVDGRMRGMGIGRKLLQAWLRMPGIAFVRGWSPVSFNVATGVGFKVIWGFIVARIALSRFRFAVALLKGARHKELLRLASVITLPNPGPTPRRYSFSTSREVPEGTDHLWTAVSEGYRFSVLRDRPYLEWRFVKHPTHTYDFIQMMDRQGLAGLAVTRITEDTPPLGVISDLIVDPRNEEAVLSLLAEALCFLRSRGAYAVLIDLPPSLASSVVTRYRCRLTQNVGMMICASGGDLGGSRMLEASSWYVSRSDSDEDY